MNKQLKSAYERYLQSTDTVLEDVYKKASIYKHRAYYYCERLMQEKKGNDLRIISHNGSVFSVGFKFTQNNIPMFAYITKTNNYFVEVK